MILAGDIGGTKTRLALYRLAGRRLELRSERSYPSREHENLDGIVAAFRAAFPGEIREACFGIAGPVRDGRSQTTNLPWTIDARVLGRSLGLPQVHLINDLEANAYGIVALAPGDLVELRAGIPGVGNAALIAAGTGLGEAGLFWDGAAHRPFGTEGGHASFAPADRLQDELLVYLRRTHEHVSWERVLSGPGLYNVYLFLRDTGRGEESPRMAERLAREDPAAVISELAIEGSAPLAAQALDLFVALYGAEAGNLALKMMATGGLYVGGGIAPKILTAMKSGTFVRAFLAKGRMKPLLESMPVKVILNDRTPLLGAACCAALRAGLLPAAENA